MVSSNTDLISALSGQVFVVLSYDCFCFFQRRQPPLNLRFSFPAMLSTIHGVLPTSNLNSTWLLGIFGASIQARCEIDAPG